MAAAVAATTKAKEKTKAKQRYLRRKKERRKHRPKTSTAPGNAAKYDDESDESEEEESAQEKEDLELPAVQELVLDAAEDAATVKRPKKRRKTTEEEPEDVNMAAPADVSTGLEQLTDHPETTEPDQLPGTLSSFPLPALPDAPSKSTLALQGLDKALVDAELVDPTQLLPIPDGEEDGGTMLSERTRKRLKDVGITELFAGTATGQQSFAHEQSQLVGDKTSSLKGGSSKVDVLICTPGRLMDHLHGTPNFSLQHLRFLVIDEADRLLAQSFQDWLVQVLAATRPPPKTIPNPILQPSKSLLPTADAVAPAFLHTLPYPIVPTFLTESRESSCQKLLFSATLTRDPGKIAALDLRNPKYFVIQESKKEGVLDVVMEKFSMPATLT
ncbi:hypothetical protein DXG03_002796, partial [Asterophora parasitica]